MKQREPQHDAHMDTRDQHIFETCFKGWTDWPPTKTDIFKKVAEQMGFPFIDMPIPREEHYVIAKCNSVEYRFWGGENYGWTRLAGAHWYTRDEMAAVPDPAPEGHEGFWMTYERAEELEG